MVLSQTALLFVGGGDHLHPPGADGMLGVEQGYDLLVSQFLCARLVKDYEPLLPGFTRFCCDGFITHTGAIFNFAGVICSPWKCETKEDVRRGLVCRQVP